MSLAAVHTASALVVRALGDAGVSDAATVTVGARCGVLVHPAPGVDTRDWVMAVNVIAELTDGTGSQLLMVGHIDDVAVTAEWCALEVVA